MFQAEDSELPSRWHLYQRSITDGIIVHCRNRGMHGINEYSPRGQLYVPHVIHAAAGRGPTERAVVVSGKSFVAAWFVRCRR